MGAAADRAGAFREVTVALLRSTDADNPMLVLAALRKACGIDDWEFHDLRRSVRSWMAKHGISRDAAETCLGHKVIRDETERAYLVHSFEREAGHRRRLARRGDR